MNIHLPNPFKGSGSRRITPESHVVLERENRRLRDNAARLDPCVCRAPRPHVEFLVRRPDGAIAPVHPFLCPACRIDQLNAQLAVLTAPPAPGGPVLVPAPADVAESAFATPAPEPVPEQVLRIVADTPTAPAASEAADVNAETQQVPVAALREAVGEGDTAQFPVVPDQRSVRPVTAVTADHLEPARVNVPPKPPAARSGFADPDAVVGFSTADLKQQVNAAAAAVPRPGVRVRLAKTG
jgi:hypothetical protein